MRAPACAVAIAPDRWLGEIHNDPPNGCPSKLTFLPDTVAVGVGTSVKSTPVTSWERGTETSCASRGSIVLGKYVVAYPETPRSGSTGTTCPTVEVTTYSPDGTA